MGLYRSSCLYVLGRPQVGRVGVASEPRPAKKDEREIGGSEYGPPVSARGAYATVFPPLVLCATGLGRGSVLAFCRSTPSVFLWTPDENRAGGASETRTSRKDEGKLGGSDSGLPGSARGIGRACAALFRRLVPYAACLGRGYVLGLVARRPTGYRRGRSTRASRRAGSASEAVATMEGRSGG
jgi:hypothetical protein